MTLPANGSPISLQDVQDEFGGAHSISISEYASKVGKSSGQTISLSDFYGKGAGPSLTLGANGSSSHCSHAPGYTCTSSWQLNAYPSGGSGGYHYSWSRVSGYGSVNHNNDLDSTIVSYAAPAGTADGSRSGTFRCTVTDSAGQATHRDVSVTFYWTTHSVGGGGGGGGTPSN